MLAPVVVASFVLVDETRSTAQLRLNAPIATEAAAVLSAAAAVVGPLHAISGCRVREIAATYRRDEDGPYSPIGTVNPAAVFTFDAAEGQQGLVAIPGLLPALLAPPLDGAQLDIDRTATAVSDLVDQLLAGPWSNPFGKKLQLLTAAYQQNRTYGAIYIP